MVRESPPLFEQVDPSEYILGPGDVLWVAADGGLPSEFSLSGAAGSVFYTSVSPDGFVLLPLVGAVEVGGLTLEEGSAAVEGAMRARIRGSRPSVGLSTPRVFRVLVSGCVGSPGMIAIKGTDRVSDALAAAGGPAPGAALSRVCVISPDDDTTLVDLNEFASGGAPASNPLVPMHSRVFVPWASQLVTVEGAFWIHGAFALSRSSEEGWTESASAVLEHLPGETVGRLVARAGGFTPWAVRESLHVVREGVEASFRIPADPGLEMLPGDRLVCPGEPLTVAVTGFVPSPGVIPYVAGRDPFYYVAQAGGFEHEARSGGTRVHLPTGERLPLDECAEVPPGSIITVPRRPLVWWQDYLAVLTGIASVIIAWKSIE